MSNCLIVQHVEPERSFAIGEALLRAGVEVETLRVFAGDVIPPGAAHFDGIVVMGGPMSATSDVGFATRRTEIGLLADAVQLGIPTLGVCLGAQLLAASSGAAVRAGDAGPEVGWAPVDLLDACQTDALFAGLPDRLNVLHWHGETFELPTGARRLVANANYSNQAFRVGEVAWGLQFHLEVTVEAVDGFLDAFASDAASATGGEKGIRAATREAVATLSTARDLVTRRFADLVAGRVKGGHLIDLR